MTMMHVLSVLLLACSAPLLAGCPPEGQSRTSLQALKASKFEVADPDRRRALSIGLVGCLGDPDPALRDGIAYAGLSQWIRAGDLDQEALRALRDDLYAMLDDGEGEGFARPFAALVLSEVARTDRIAAWMTADERGFMVDKAAVYVETVRDYRGFDDAEGWRHGVAHGADWLLQLALNPALDAGQHERILEAIATQAVPESAHAYVFGEPARLARPLVAVARRGLRSEADWRTWFADLPARIGEPELAYADSAWLARRHDLVAFLAGLYVEVDRSEDPQLRALKPGIVSALQSVP